MNSDRLRLKSYRTVRYQTDIIYKLYNTTLKEFKNKKCTLKRQGDLVKIHRLATGKDEESKKSGTEGYENGTEKPNKWMVEAVTMATEFNIPDYFTDSSGFDSEFEKNLSFSKLFSLIFFKCLIFFKFLENFKIS